MGGKALFLNADDTCLDRELNIFGDGLIVKTSSKFAGMTVMLSVTPPKVGPPLHRHSREDESFYVLEGEYLFESDGEQKKVGPGTFVYLPRGTAHTFQNLSDTPGKMLILAQPAGIEEFFSEIEQSTRGMKEVDMNVVLPIFEKYGITFLGPPIGTRKSQQ